MIRAVSFVAALLVGPATLAAAEFKQLKGSAIKSRLTGMEFTDGVHYAETFEAGGALTGTYVGKRRRGTWRVDGDELCLKRESDTERCFEVWTAGQDLQLRQAGMDDKEEGTLRRPKGRVSSLSLKSQPRLST